MDDDEAVEADADREAASATEEVDESDADAEATPGDVGPAATSDDDRGPKDPLERNRTNQTPTASNRDGSGTSQAELEGDSEGGETDFETGSADEETDDVGETETAVSGTVASAPSETDLEPGEETGLGSREETDSGSDADDGGAVDSDAEDRVAVDADAEGRDAADPENEAPRPGVPDTDRNVPEDVQKYARFKKMDGAQYDRVNEFLRDRTYVTAREWAIARLCADFRTETGVEMTKIGENLPELIPFMTDTYTPQAVNQARSSFDGKVRKAGATFLYGAMCDFYTAEELDDVMYEVTEVAKFLLEVEGVDLTVEEELEAEDRISSVMREVRRASKELREREDE